MYTGLGNLSTNNKIVFICRDTLQKTNEYVQFYKTFTKYELNM